MAGNFQNYKYDVPRNQPVGFVLEKGSSLKIAFISLIEDVFLPNLRYLSAYLRSQGHTTKLIYLPWNFTDKTLNSSNSFRYPYPQSVLDQIAAACRDCDLIGLSLMSCHLDNAVYVTQFLRTRLPAPIIWGGIHATIRPLECLQYADLVCVGEGELSLSQLVNEMAQGKPWQSINARGILKRSANGEPVEVVSSPLVENLDQLPFPDTELEHQYVLYEGNLVQLTSSLLTRCIGFGYQAMFSRGCPYACTYCCNNALRNLNGRKLPVRWRSVDNRIAELKMMVDLLPDLRTVSFTDDAFLAQPMELLNDFTARYRQLIGLPFFLLTTPRSVNEAKVMALAEAGLYHLCVGIQSGSQRIFKKLYCRPESLPEVLSASRCLKQISKKLNRPIMVRYDFILDNPWETEEDVEASIRLCTELAKPFNAAMFSLTLYPGTDLYERARKEGLITDELNQVNRASQLMPKRTYLNGVFAAVAANAPRWIIIALLWKPCRRRAARALPYWVASFFEFIKMVKGFFGYLRRRQWTLIGFFLLPSLGKLRSIVKPAQPVNVRPKFMGGIGCVAGGHPTLSAP